MYVRDVLKEHLFHVVAHQVGFIEEQYQFGISTPLQHLLTNLVETN